jgi:hypothetical protein
MLSTGLHFASESTLVDFERAIRRLSDNPKIGAMDHAEIVRDLVAEPLPYLGTVRRRNLRISRRNSLKVL